MRYETRNPAAAHRAVIIGTCGFRGLFEALKRGVALPAAAFASLVELLREEESRQGERRRRAPC
jgi:hypothetical protein